jgi:small nuclear ribonucleoprotein (snRNP)-like protein
MRETDDPTEELEESAERPGLESTGSEAAYFRSLIDSKKRVIVVLKTGDRIRGKVRYYDRHCFSIGPTGGGPNIFLRKTNVKYLYEE